MPSKTILTTLLFALTIPVHSFADETVKDTLRFDSSFADHPSTLLEGRISGLRTCRTDGSLNGSYSTFIRGVNSLRGQNEPLWIVDGAVLVSDGTEFNNLSFLNPYDIESIQVIKNVSDAARYGSKGANGVIVVNTRKERREGTRFSWNSNFGLSFPYLGGESFRNAFVHNHSFNLSYVKGLSSLNISARLKNDNGIVNGTGNTFGGLRIAYEAKANPVVRFSVNSIFSIGKMYDQSIGASYGQASLMMVQRDPDAWTEDTVEGWLKDYDNDAAEMRMVTSADLTLNFTGNLSLKTVAGVDYRNLSGYEWYGKGTAVGLEKNGKAAINTDANLRYDLNSTLAWNRHFGKHSVKLHAGAELSGDWIRNDRMNGTDFFSHELRAKGMNIHADKTVIDNNSADYFNWSLLAGAEWDYQDKIGLNLLYKPSFTPRYGSAAIHYYSVSAYARIADFLKIKAGYGKSGREKYVPYSSFGDYLHFEYPSVEKSIQYYYEALNRAWSKEFNVGLDLTFFKGRLGLSATCFSKRTLDGFFAYCFGRKGNQTLWFPADRSDFFDLSSGIVTRGCELDVNGTIIRSGKTRWSIDTDLAIGKTSLGNICAEDLPGQDYFEDLIPKFHGGAGTTLTIGSLTFDILGTFATGYSMFNLSRMQIEHPGNTGIALEDYLEQAGWFRLRRISAGYCFNIGKDTFVKSVKVSLNAFNLLTASRYSGWNPVVSNLGTDYGTYPDARSLVAGVNINF